MTSSTPWKNLSRIEAGILVKKWAAALAITALAAYPFAVWFGLQQGLARPLALLLLFLLALRGLLVPRNKRRYFFWVLLAALAIIFPTLYFNQADYLLFYPVLVNAVMLTLFASSLFGQQSAVEKIARITEPDLPPAGVLYTRRVTQVWCVFFVANGLIALYTALYCSHAQWVFYNGFLSYVLTGVLFLLELLWRHYRRRAA